MRIAELHITPIALGEPPLLNAAGLHAPYCLRTVVELVTDDGLQLLAAVPGAETAEAGDSVPAAEVEDDEENAETNE